LRSFGCCLSNIQTSFRSAFVKDDCGQNRAERTRECFINVTTRTTTERSGFAERVAGDGTSQATLLVGTQLPAGEPAAIPARLVDHINRILSSTESARFAVGYFFLSGLESIAHRLADVETVRSTILNQLSHSGAPAFDPKEVEFVLEAITRL